MTGWRCWCWWESRLRSGLLVIVVVRRHPVIRWVGPSAPVLLSLAIIGQVRLLSWPMLLRLTTASPGHNTRRATDDEPVRGELFRARTPEVGIISNQGVLSPPVETRQEDWQLHLQIWSFIQYFVFCSASDQTKLTTTENSSFYQKAIFSSPLIFIMSWLNPRKTTSL